MNCHLSIALRIVLYIIHFISVGSDKRDILRHCKHVMAILDQAGAIDERVTANKLLDSWQGKVASLRVKGHDAPVVAIEKKERIFGLHAAEWIPWGVLSLYALLNNQLYSPRYRYGILHNQLYSPRYRYGILHNQLYSPRYRYGIRHNQLYSPRYRYGILHYQLYSPR